MVETHLKKDNVFTVPKYNFFGQNRLQLHHNAKKGSGGVCFLIHERVLKSFTVKVLDKTFEGILWIQLTNKHDSSVNFVLCACYLPPQDSSRGNITLEYFTTLLSQVYKYADIGDIIIGGDFNSRIGIKQDYDKSLCEYKIKPRVSIDNVNNNSENFLNFLNDACMCVLNGRIGEDNYTSISKKGKAVVDYLITSYGNFENITNFTVNTITDIIKTYGLKHLISDVLPDHSVITCKIKYSENIDTNGNEQMKVKDEIKQTNFRKYDVRNIDNNLLLPNVLNELLIKIEMLEQQEIDKDGINKTYNDFVNIIHKDMNEHLNFKDINCKNLRNKGKSKYKPWWNENLQTLWNDAVKSEKIYLNFKGPNGLKKVYLQTFKQMKNKFDKEYRKSKRIYQSDKQIEISQLNTDDPKAFWAEINKLGPGNKTNTIPMEKVENDGNINTNIQDVLKNWEYEYKTLCDKVKNNMFNEQFLNEAKEVINNWESEYSDLLTNNDTNYEPGNIHNDCLNKQLTLSEIEKAISKLKNGKSVGIENIANEILKTGKLNNILLKLFSKCFETGLIPDQWNMSIINPIPKPGKDCRIPKNTRPISLVSTVYKVFSSVLNNRLKQYIESNNILSDEQNGFRNMRSCIDHLYVLITILKQRKLKKKETFVCFIDFQRAFDSVTHDLLVYKLLKNGIDGKFLKILKNSYSNMYSAIRLNGYYTEWFPVNSGVRQGDVLSSTLFGIYIDDLVQEIKDLNMGIHFEDVFINILLYADDVLLIAESENELQCMINKVAEWCQKWRLAVNCNKTNIIHFCKKNVNKLYTFTIFNEPIEVVESYRYLGLMLFEDLNITKSVEILVNSASRAFGSMLNKHYAINGFDYDTYTKLYESLVVPVLLYGSPIWGLSHYPKCETLQHKIMRTYLGASKPTPIPVLYKDLRWIPIAIRTKLEAISFWYKLCRLPDNRLTKRVFLIDKQINQHRRNSWCCKLKQLLESTQDNVWDNLNYDNITRKAIQDNAEVKLLNEFHIGLNDQMQNMSRLSLFCDLTQHNETNSYCKLRNRHHRSLLVKLRSNTLPIAIELGRYRSIPREDRLCVYCDTSSVEDDIHILFHCSCYLDLRLSFLNKINNMCPDLLELNPREKLICLLNSENHLILTVLANYLFSIIKKRRLFSHT